MSVINKIAKAIIPNGLKKILWDFYYFFLIKYMPFRYRRLLKKLKKKEKIKIAFLIYLASSWKYDNLFRLLLRDSRFDPIIIICPINSYDSETMFSELNRAVDFFTRQNYPVISTWKEHSQGWMDIKEEIRPDIVFFSNPWAELCKPEYYIFNFLDRITCYAPYGFKSSHLYEAIFNKPFQNLLWTIFYETEMHKEMAYRYARNKGVNGLVTGYPGMDNLLDESYKPGFPWKIKDKSYRRIIWAPHHSIMGKSDSNVGFSTFLEYSGFMLRMAEEFRDRIQISFKPHPLLRPKMNNHPDWGREKTDIYFGQWESMTNTQVDESNYIDLFLTSDALINDGESFMVEYLYTKKPAMFLVADEDVTDRFNEFGKQAFEHLYQGRCEKDIYSFINEVVIGGNDYLGEERIKFFETLVRPPHNKLASENIYNYIKAAVSL